VTRLIKSGEAEFWSEFGALDEISPEESLVIADFGMGSDSPILLDYRFNSASPRVLRLRWSDQGRNNHWVLCASDFDTFADMLGLEHPAD
jgi:hypothetical protein